MWLGYVSHGMGLELCKVWIQTMKQMFPSSKQPVAKSSRVDNMSGDNVNVTKLKQAIERAKKRGIAHGWSDGYQNGLNEALYLIDVVLNSSTVKRTNTER